MSYYVCFLDLLGQRAFFDDVKENLQDGKTIVRIAQVSYVIEALGNYAEKRIGRELRGVAGVSLCSDSLEIWLCGDEKLDAWVRLLVKLVHVSLHYFVPVRGAIARGEGVVDDNDVFSGLPLQEAIEAESNRAIYPRIVLSGSMRSWVNHQLQKCRDGIPGFAIDVDGQFVLDYMDRTWMRDLSFQKERARVSDIVQWVYSEYCRLCHHPGSDAGYNCKNLKLAQKYAMWLDYLRRTLQLADGVIEEMPQEFSVEIDIGNRVKWEVQNYVVLYLKLESPLLEVEDSRNLFSDEALGKELSWSTDMVKNLGFFIKKVDNSLRSSSSYLEEMRDVKVHVQYLGDMLLVYAPEKRDIVRSMYSLTVLRTCELIRKIASRGTFVRGALMRGLGWELSTEGGHRTLYGPVMSDAYRLMTDIAWKPRIVIDEEIFEVVSSRASYGPGPDGDWLPKYSKRDYDGVGIVNYLVYDNEYVMAKPDEARTVVSDLKKSCESILRYVKFLAGRTERHDYASHAQRLVPLYEEMSSALMDWERGTSTVAMTR